MKIYKYFNILLLILCSLTLLSQDQKSEGVPFSEVEFVPIFPGCELSDEESLELSNSELNLYFKNCFQEKIQKHVSDNFNYPNEAIEKGLQGRVYAQFIIGRTGYITKIKVRGPNEILENEAVKIINKLPVMKKPGYIYDDSINKKVAVKVTFSIPITWRLQ